MPLHAAQPPETAELIAATNFTRLARSPATELTQLGDADVSAMALAMPHPIYTMSLADLLQRRSIDDVGDNDITGWRYLVQNQERTVASVELAVDPETAQLRFSQIQSEAVAESTEATIGAAQESDVVRGGSFEIRLLRVPALYTVALWLGNPDGQPGNDLMVPLAPAPSGLEANRVYPASEFLEILYQKAQEHGENGPALVDDEP